MGMIPVQRDGKPIRTSAPFSGLGQDWRVPSHGCEPEQVQCCEAAQYGWLGTFGIPWQAQIAFKSEPLESPIEEPVCRWQFTSTITKIFESYGNELDSANGYLWRVYKNCDNLSPEDMGGWYDASDQSPTFPYLRLFSDFGCCEVSREFVGYEIEFDQTYDEVGIALFAVEESGREWLVKCQILYCRGQCTDCAPGCLDVIVSDYPVQGRVFIERVVVGQQLHSSFIELGRKTIDWRCCTGRYGTPIQHQVDVVAFAEDTSDMNGTHTLYSNTSVSSDGDISNGCAWYKSWTKSHYFPPVVGCSSSDPGQLSVAQGYWYHRARGVSVFPTVRRYTDVMGTLEGSPTTGDHVVYWVGSADAFGTLTWQQALLLSNFGLLISGRATQGKKLTTTCPATELPSQVLYPYNRSGFKLQGSDGIEVFGGDPDEPCWVGVYGGPPRDVEADVIDSENYDTVFRNNSPNYLRAVTSRDWVSKCEGCYYNPSIAEDPDCDFRNMDYSGVRLLEGNVKPCYTMQVMSSAEDGLGECPEPQVGPPERPPGIPPIPDPQCSCELIKIEHNLTYIIADELTIIGEPEDENCPPDGFSDLCAFGEVYYALVNLSAYVVPRFRCDPVPEVTNVFIDPGRFGQIRVCRESVTIEGAPDGGDTEIDPGEQVPPVKVKYTALLAICRRSNCPDPDTATEEDYEKEPKFVITTNLPGCHKYVPIECEPTRCECVLDRIEFNVRANECFDPSSPCSTGTCNLVLDTLCEVCEFGELSDITWTFCYGTAGTLPPCGDVTVVQGTGCPPSQNVSYDRDIGFRLEVVLPISPFCEARNSIGGGFLGVLGGSACDE